MVLLIREIEECKEILGAHKTTMDRMLDMLRELGKIECNTKNQEVQFLLTVRWSN